MSSACVSSVALITTPIRPWSRIPVRLLVDTLGGVCQRVSGGVGCLAGWRSWIPNTTSDRPCGSREPRQVEGATTTARSLAVIPTSSRCSTGPPTATGRARDGNRPVRCRRDAGDGCVAPPWPGPPCLWRMTASNSADGEAIARSRRRPKSPEQRCSSSACSPSCSHARGGLTRRSAASRATVRSVEPSVFGRALRVTYLISVIGCLRVGSLLVVLGAVT